MEKNSEITKAEKARNNIAVLTFGLSFTFYLTYFFILCFEVSKGLIPLIFLSLPIAGLLYYASWAFKGINRDPFSQKVIFYSFSLLFTVALSEIIISHFHEYIIASLIFGLLPLLSFFLVEKSF